MRAAQRYDRRNIEAFYKSSRGIRRIEATKWKQDRFGLPFYCTGNLLRRTFGIRGESEQYLNIQVDAQFYFKLS